MKGVAVDGYCLKLDVYHSIMYTIATVDVKQPIAVELELRTIGFGTTKVDAAHVYDAYTEEVLPERVETKSDYYPSILDF
jgi:hypothetical protein